MQLFFDTYDPVQSNVKQGSDVRKYTDQIVKLLAVDSDNHAPPICRFSWAHFAFVGVLEKADQTFTLFMPDGTPVRATIDVTFKELGQEQVDQAGRLFSADFAKHYVVRRGDTLSNIAADKYGDPALWRPIAEENELDDPLALEPGQLLVIPAVA
jgi:nucleoid-associated protein YgaU